jgi:TRAP transporter TAXI family solute receptor
MLHNDLVVHSVMTKEWADKNGVKSFEDIAAKQPPMRLAVNLVANLQSTLSMYVALFDAFGIKEAEVTSRGGSLFRGNSNNGLEALRDGKIDVFINGGFVPTAQLTDLSRGRQLVWLSGSPDKIKVAAAAWGYDPIIIPKSAYSFLDKDEMAITQWSAVLAGNHVSDETVYKFMKALFDDRDRVRAIHPSLAAFAAETVVRNPTPVPYHPGATKYYREKGLPK